MNAIVRHGFAPQTLTEAIQFSEMLSRSTMVPKNYQGKAEDILVACQWGYEVGLQPLQALQNIAVINGKPSIYGDAALALVQNSSVCEDIEESIEGEGTPNPTAVCIARRKGRKPVKATFSVDDAKRAGLWGKQGPWTAYPKRMLQMRARGFAIRDAFPDVLKGLITSEEASDYQVEEKSSVIAAPAVLEAIPKAVSSPDFSDLEEPLEAPPARYELHLPDGSVYGKYPNLEEWVEAYGELVQRIRKSRKFSEEERREKINGLRAANKAQRDALPLKNQTRLMDLTNGPLATDEQV